MFGLLKALRRSFRSNRPTSRRQSAHRAFFEQLGGPLFAPATPGRRADWKPAVEALEERSLMSATSAVAWTSGGATHSAFYAIGQNDNVEVSVDGGRFTNLDGYAKQVSAGLDPFNNPEVYAIAADNAVWLNKGSGWVSLGGYFKAISATVQNTIYAIGTDDDVYVGHGVAGSGWFNTGLKATQISAGADGGNPEVYAIGFNNNVYAGNGSGGVGSFANWGGFAKQISATMDSTVYAIGPDNGVYKDSGSGSGSGWVSLGGYAKQISAGIDSAFGPFVFAIGLNDGLWSNHGSGWISLGSTYVTEVSGPTIANFGVSLPADTAYAVANGHGALLHENTTFTSLGGYVQTLSGSASNDTNSWEPATRDTSAVAWTSGSVTHTALYAIGPNDSVEESVDGGSFTNLGGYAKQVSAGLDAFNKPEVYLIGADNAVWVNKGSGWVSLGGYLKEISATVENTIYAIGTDDNVYLAHGTAGLGWFSTGLKARQISAGADAIGNPEVYAIGFNNNVYAGNGSGGVGSFANWGGYVKQISATMDGTVYAIGADNAVYRDSGSGSGSGWVDLGGYAKQISASVTGGNGSSVVFILGLNDGLWSNHGSGWVSLGSTYVTEVSAPSIANFGVSLPGDLAYAVADGHGGLLHTATIFSPLVGETVE